MHRLTAVLFGLTATAAYAAALTPQEFTTQAATSGIAEITLAQMAAKKSNNADVKRYAQRMIRDHGRADTTLKKIAKRSHVTLPAAPTAEQQAAADKLRGMSGQDFDRAYAQQMVADHQQAVELFRQASTDSALDANLRDFAKKTLPTLEHHLQEARQLDQQVARAD